MGGGFPGWGGMGVPRSGPPRPGRARAGGAIPGGTKPRLCLAPAGAVPGRWPVPPGRPAGGRGHGWGSGTRLGSVGHPPLAARQPLCRRRGPRRRRWPRSEVGQCQRRVPPPRPPLGTGGPGLTPRVPPRCPLRHRGELRLRVPVPFRQVRRGRGGRGRHGTPRLGSWGMWHPMARDTGDVARHEQGPGIMEDMGPHGWGSRGHRGSATPWMGSWGTWHPIASVLGDMGDVPPHSWCSGWRGGDVPPPGRGAG